jgi:hypothetical protein
VSRLNYHRTYANSVKSTRLPHYRTSFVDQREFRHPLDDKYRCGFDPKDKNLRQCVDHWRKCDSESCTRKFHDYQNLKDELLRAYSR